MPIGAICASKEVSRAFTAGAHGTTFGGHPVSCAAALAEVDEIVSGKLPENAKKMGDYFSEGLNTIPHVKEVRHKGLLVGVEFEDAVDATELKHKCVDKRLLVTAIGNSIIRMVRPLIVTEKECDEAVRIIREAVEEL